MTSNNNNQGISPVTGPENNDKMVPLLSTKESNETTEDLITQSQSRRLFSTMYNASVYFGAIVGCFIQFSSLGANYFLLFFFGRDLELAERKNDVYLFTLTWSLISSLMGLYILFLSRSLIYSAGQVLMKMNSSSRPTRFRSINFAKCFELPFTFGVLGGVCSCWAVVDWLLGLRSHAYHALFTLTVVYVLKAIFEACTSDRSDESDEDDNEYCETDLNQLHQAEIQEQVNTVNKDFKIKAMAAGALIGFFIQFSSLGTTFVADAAFYENKDLTMPVVEISRKRMFLLSLGWSFVFGSMAVGILLSLRYLTELVCNHFLSRSMRSVIDNNEQEQSIVGSWMINLEFFFSFGCLVGVNLAWLATDASLGLDTVLWRSLCTLAVACVWGSSVAYWFGLHKFTSQLSWQQLEQSRKVVKTAKTTCEGYIVV